MTQPGSVSRSLIIAALFLPLTVASQETSAPVRAQYQILLKALTYDRNFKTRCADTIRLGVLYQSTYRESEQVKAQMASVGREFASNRIEELPIQIIPVDLSAGQNLEAEIRARRVNTLYVAPLRGLDVSRISIMARKNKMLTLTGVTAYVERGLSIGVELRAGRPSLVVNRQACQAEGADFTSQLLELARIVR